MNLITNHFEEMNYDSDDNDWGWYVDLENTKKSNNYVKNLDTNINTDISIDNSNVKINSYDKKYNKDLIRGLQYMNILCSTTIIIVWVYCFI